MYCPKCGGENVDGAVRCAACSFEFAGSGAVATSVEAKTSRAAVAALVLGILVFVTCGITALYCRISEDIGKQWPAQGKGHGDNGPCPACAVYHPPLRDPHARTEPCQGYRQKSGLRDQPEDPVNVDGSVCKRLRRRGGHGR